MQQSCFPSHHSYKYSQCRLCLNHLFTYCRIHPVQWKYTGYQKPKNIFKKVSYQENIWLDWCESSENNKGWTQTNTTVLFFFYLCGTEQSGAKLAFLITATLAHVPLQCFNQMRKHSQSFSGQIRRPELVWKNKLVVLETEWPLCLWCLSLLYFL